ncbi:MAG TPA: PaaI family thioesterase [Candidatus Dormibacteraeota bacterium]|nr:PaaI family thioesterase [Candidatus Dormibacteraeota bacterium]
MRFNFDGSRVTCLYTVPARFQSWEGIIHGGMVGLMLDEAMGWAAVHAGHPGVTGKMEMRLRHSVKVGETVRVIGQVDEIRRSLVRASAWVERASDSVRLAEGSATLMAVPTNIVMAEGFQSGSGAGASSG